MTQTSLSVSQPASLSASMSASVPLLKIGIIGSGGLADQWLAPAFAGLDGACLWSVLSRDIKSATAFAVKHGLKAQQPAFDNIDSFLADPELDAVIIASPDTLHASQALACVKAGKHVLVEKPMTTSSADAQSLIAAAAAANVRLAVGYHLRFHAGHRLLRQAIIDGKLGAVRHMDI